MFSADDLIKSNDEMFDRFREIFNGERQATDKEFAELKLLQGVMYSLIRDDNIINSMNSYVRNKGIK